MSILEISSTQNEKDNWSAINRIVYSKLSSFVDNVVEGSSGYGR